jgi:hypothetical protein
VNASGGVDTVNIVSSGTNAIIFSANNTTVNLSLKPGLNQIEYINGFNNTDALNIVGLGALTLSAITNNVGPSLPGQVNLYDASNDLVAELVFDSATTITQLEPSTANMGGAGTSIKFDAPPGPQDPTIAGSQVNWSYIHTHESPGGVTQLAPYIPADPSGLTVAQGVDLGRGSPSIFTNTFSASVISQNPNLQFLASFLGETHADALDDLQPQVTVSGNPTAVSVSITTTEAYALTDAAETKFYNQISTAYNAGETTGVAWNELTAGQQTALLDIAYNFGASALLGLKTGVPWHLWTDALSGYWEGAAYEIQDNTPGATSAGQIARDQNNAQLLYPGYQSSATYVSAPPVQLASNPLETATVTAFVVNSVSTGTTYSLDPPGPDLILVEAGGSPLFSSITLPESAATEYLVSYAVGSNWSVNQLTAAGATVDFTAGATGISIVMLDGSIDPAAGAPEFAFYVTFATTGNFVGEALSSFPGDDDFADLGKSGFLIENASGAVVEGEVANGQASYNQVAALGPEWSFKGTGDFLSDGGTGFLVENTSGGVVVGEGSVGDPSHYAQVGALGREWSFEGTGDFLGHGDDQYLIENAAGAVDVGEVVNGQAQYTQVAALGPEWSFEGAGDFLGNGVSDFLIENTSGAVVVAEVGSNGQAQYTQVTALGHEWSFKETGDFLGDGLGDFLIENTNGAVVIGEVVNGQAQYTQIAALGAEWKFVGAGDYLGEGHDQFLIENASGAVDVGDWYNGQIHYTQVAALGSEWTFH